MFNNIPNGWRPAITKLILVIAGLYLVALCIPALARTFLADTKWVCSNTKEVKEALVVNGEKIIGFGKIEEDILMSFWYGKDGDWTVVATHASSEKSCIVLFGKNFTPVNPKDYI
jgi:hypothetical protein